MSQASSKHAISLQYQVRTSRTGYREIERLLPPLGEFQNAAVRHRQLLGRLGVPTREILRHQNAGITDLRAHDPDFGNIARRLVESVAKRVNDAYSRTLTVQGARFPRTRSPYAFRTLEISEPRVQHIQLIDDNKSCRWRRLFLPVEDEVKHPVRRYRIDHRPTSRTIEAETYGRKDPRDSGSPGWHERAFGTKMAEWPVAVGNQARAPVAHSARSLRRGVGNGD